MPDLALDSEDPATRRPPIRQPGFASIISRYERVDICISVLHFFHLLQLASYLTFQSSVQISDFVSASIYHGQPYSPPFYLSLNLDTPIFFEPNPPTPKITIIQSPPSCQNRPSVSLRHMAREPSHPQEWQNPHHTITSPGLFQVEDRGDLLPIVAHRFAGKSSYLGIMELVDDIFYVMGNLTFSTFTSIQHA